MEIMSIEGLSARVENISDATVRVGGKTIIPGTEADIPLFVISKKIADFINLNGSVAFKGYFSDADPINVGGSSEEVLSMADIKIRIKNASEETVVVGGVAIVAGETSDAPFFTVSGSLADRINVVDDIEFLGYVLDGDIISVGPAGGVVGGGGVGDGDVGDGDGGAGEGTDNFFGETYTREELEGMTKADLQVILSGMGLPTSGNKPELIDRILGEETMEM